MIYQITYVSSATGPFSFSDLPELLSTSRRNNARLGVTGMLLYKDGNFMQVIEGQEETVESLYRRIERDTRHSGIIRLLRTRSETRDFPDWSMGFTDLDSPEVTETRDLPAYSDFLDAPLTGEEFSGDPTRAQRLLLTFKRGM